MSPTHRPPLLLLVCFPSSVHSARWVNVLRSTPFRVIVFPSLLQDYCMEFHWTRVVHDERDAEALGPGEVGIVDSSTIASIGSSAREQRLGFRYPPSAVAATPEQMPSPDALVQVIRRLHPDLVHNLELQNGGYLCLEARARHGSGFPRWLASSWGSDTFLYRKLPEHRERLVRMAHALDGFHSDCTRDHATFREMGFAGLPFPDVAASGGVDLACYPHPDTLPAPSQRRVLLVKGYHGWAGRAQDVLLALHQIAPQLRGLHIRVANPATSVVQMVEALRREDGLDIVADTYFPDHARAVERLAQARVVVGYGISDGISTTLLEAMAVGTFCIQADTACGCEWIRSGIDGLEVPAHDVDSLAQAILRAVSDDALVDAPVIRNRREVERRWSIQAVTPLVARGYQALLNSSKGAVA